MGKKLIWRRQKRNGESLAASSCSYAGELDFVAIFIYSQGEDGIPHIRCRYTISGDTIDSSSFHYPKDALEWLEGALNEAIVVNIENPAKEKK